MKDFLLRNLVGVIAVLYRIEHFFDRDDRLFRWIITENAHWIAKNHAGWRETHRDKLPPTPPNIHKDNGHKLN
jgi:hypothetical protein